MLVTQRGGVFKKGLENWFSTAKKCFGQVLPNPKPSEHVKNNKNYFLKTGVQDDPRRRRLVISESVNKQDMDKLAINLNSRFKTKLVVGGYGEKRTFYSAPKSGELSVHLGHDVVVPKNTPLYSPAKGEVIASFWVRNNQQEGNVFTSVNGIGGVVVVKYKISDLTLELADKEWVYVKYKGFINNEKKTIVSKVPKFAFGFEHKLYLPRFWQNQKVSDTTLYQVTKDDYDKFLADHRENFTSKEYEVFVSNQEEIIVSFMHLARKNPKIFGSGNKIKTIKGYKPPEDNESTYEVIVNKNIDINHPQKVTKHSLIGYVGGFQENGYWPPHAHINTNFFLKNKRCFNHQASRYNLDHKRKDKEFFDMVSIMSPRGVLNINPKAVDTNEKLTGNLAIYSFFDPNKIFRLYDQNTKKVYLDDLV